MTNICTRCIMDRSDPEIVFDASGVCNHCHSHDRLLAAFPKGEAGRKALEAIAARIREEGRRKEYDCLIGLSGGVDSTYLAALVKDLGLRPLAVHFDSGWDSELAVHNIERLVTELDLELHTMVVDWEEMRDLQLAFLKAGVANCDVPTDHGFTAALYHVAVREKIPYLLSGANLATESHLPRAWGYSARDLRHLRAIHARFGRHPLVQFPMLSLPYQAYARLVAGFRKIDPLNYIDFVKADAMKEIETRLGWQYYGGKHYESVFTRFFQGYYLPRRFGIDKRRSHLSALVASKQMTRQDALAEMEKPPADPDQMERDKLYVLKKLGISVDEFEAIMRSPTKTHRDYPSNEFLFRTINAIRARVPAL